MRDDETTDTRGKRGFVSIKAKYPGTCRRCTQPFGTGVTIRYGGPGRCYHLAAQCPATQSDVAAADAAAVRAESAPRKPVTPQLPPVLPASAYQRAARIDLGADLRAIAEGVQR